MQFPGTFGQILGLPTPLGLAPPLRNPGPALGFENKGRFHPMYRRNIFGHFLNRTVLKVLSKCLHLHMYLLSIEKYKADGRNEKMIQQNID